MMRALVFSVALGAGSAFASEDPAQTIVDQVFEILSDAVAAAGFHEVVAIDHSRLAAEEGVEMPPSRVQLFVDPALNSLILAQSIRAGLDLPFRVLAYGATDEAKVTYTPFEFLKQRHDLDDAEFGERFDNRLAEVLGSVSTNTRHPVSAPAEAGFGILEIVSAHNVSTSIERLRTAVLSQGDSLWFGEVDFQAEAAELGVDLPPATLLLFGGPAPGGAAMAEFPVLGLDAFCQKLLVFEDETGQTRVMYNSITSLAELHYGQSEEVHRALDQRLTQTFSGALQ